MSDTPKQPETSDRLAKVIARAGLCSRRDAEGWISAGRVAVNGKKVLTPAFNVTSRDRIEVDGLPLAARQGTRVWLYHKPAGLVVTEKDPEGRTTIFEALEKKGLPRVLTVGRLDINTEGLLLLTNDGGLKRVLELPSTGWLRRYRARAFGSVTQAQLDGLRDGVTVDGVQYGPIQAVLEREQGANVWLVLGLREGKNREVRNVLGSLGLEVNRLIRISYGPFQLGDLPEGGIEAVRSRMLRDQLGKKLAEAAGVDFESEMPELAPPRDDRPVRSPRDRDHSRPNPPRGAARGAGERRPGFGRDEGERPAGRPRRIHFDEEGRAPETFEPKAAGRPRRDEADRPARPGQRPDRPEGRKSFGDRPPRRDGGPARSGFGDRPKRDFGDKPARGGFGDRPQRDFGDRPARGPRKQGGFAERPARDGKPGGKPFGPRKPFADRSDRPRSFGDRPFGDKPRSPRPGDRPFSGKPGNRPGGGRPPGNRPGGGRPSGGRPAGPRKPRG
ncbi:pseudouridine synthase [Devosia honganensis]|uniref:Pseudouridine synthase n=1 Tax=Devosia honganensis TaxID=1610527 RepID=A0ABV7X1K2_9HYPH